MLDPPLYRWGVPPVVIRCVHWTMQMGVLLTWIMTQSTAIVMKATLKLLCWLTWILTWILLSNPGVLCNKGYPSETHLKLKSREISFVHNFRFNCSIGLQFCTEHGSGLAIENYDDTVQWRICAAPFVCLFSRTLPLCLNVTIVFAIIYNVATRYLIHS